MKTKLKKYRKDRISFYVLIQKHPSPSSSQVREIHQQHKAPYKIHSAQKNLIYVRRSHYIVAQKKHHDSCQCSFT